MQFTIVGAGALGTILGAHLTAAGHDVTMLARGARAQALADGGLRLRGLADIEARCRVVTEPSGITTPGVLVYAVKTYHMDAAVAGLRAARPEAVFSVANGVMKNEQLAAAHGEAGVIGCMANFSGELEADGVVRFTRNVRLALGPLPGYRGPPVDDIVAAIDGAGIVTALEPDVEAVEWSKFTGWVALFALALIARAPTGVYLRNPSFARLGVALVREAGAIAAARGIAVFDMSPMPVASVIEGSFEEAVKCLQETGAAFAESAPDHRMSALQDLEAGRRLEVAETLGYAVAEAERLGIDAPTLRLARDIAAGLDTLAPSA